MLLVEDNEVNQLVGVRMLEKRGYVVDVAANGQLALEMSARRSYLIIFMDCQMPVLDGYQAASQIRRREGHGEHVPIVAMTANTIKGDREKCLASGMDDYLGKPFTGVALDAVIARALATGRRDGDPTAETVGRRMTTAAPVLDPAVLEDLCLGDDGIRSDLVDMFLAQAAAAVDEIALMVQNGDAQGLFAEAHHLKGSSGSLGALRLAELSELLCVAGRSADLVGAAELLVELREVVQLTRRALGAPADLQSGAHAG
jgi:CheY-like chemotaxis protein/HPt (histidine-containing phosphotransfer) domain-containing protein